MSDTRAGRTETGNGDLPLHSDQHCRRALVAYLVVTACLAALLVIAVSSGFLDVILRAQTPFIYSLQASQESNDVYTDHQRVVTPLMACYWPSPPRKGVPMSASETLVVQNPRLLYLAFQIDPFAPPPIPVAAPVGQAAVPAQPPDQSWEASPLRMLQIVPWHREISSLSAMIAFKRIGFAQAAATARVSNERLHLWAILVGAVTTILIGLKTTFSGRSCLSTYVGFLAIVASASGTALASLTSTYAPADEFSQSSLALAQLRRGHVELSVLVDRLQSKCDPNALLDGKARETLTDIATRMTDVIVPKGRDQSTSGATESVTKPTH